MRVTAITAWFPTPKAPTSGVFVVKDLQALQQEGQQVHLLHLVGPRHDDGLRELTYEGIPVRRVPFAPFNPMSVWRAARVLPRYLYGTQVLHTMAMSSLLPVLLARLLSPRIRPLPWIHTEHWGGIANPATLTWPLRLARQVILRLEKFPDVVVAVCPRLARPLATVRGSSRIFGMPAETATNSQPEKRVTVVVPCVVEPVTALAPRRLPEQPWRLISVGGLVPGKDPLLAVQVLAQLREHGIAASLLWLGDGPLRAQVETLAAELGVTVELPGPQPFARVSAELQRADLFIGPTRGENFFTSCAEAVLHGRPVVVGDNGGHLDYLHPEVGRIIHGFSPEDYAAAVRELLENPDTPEAQDIAGTIGDAFSAANSGRSYATIYQSLYGRNAENLAQREALLSQLPSWNGTR